MDAGCPRVLRRQEGSAVVDFVLVLGLLLPLVLGIAQLCVYLYERNVVLAAVSEGARVAGAEGHDVPDGVSAARDLLQAGVGGNARRFVLRGERGTDRTVSIVAEGSFQAFVPFLPDLPVSVRASCHVEGRW